MRRVRASFEKILGGQEADRDRFGVGERKAMESKRICAVQNTNFL